MTVIDDTTFSECNTLTDIKLPDSLKTIGEGAFSSCSALTNIELPDGVTNIGASAFSGCSSLTNIKLPDGVKTIGSGAFSKCSALANIELPGGVTNIGVSAFSGCSSLTNIKLPDGVKTIGSGAFANCSALANIELPDSLKTIGYKAFANCSSLANIELPDGVTNIDDYTFNGCPIKRIYCHPTIPPLAGNDAFNDSILNNAILYVPQDWKDLYELTAPWCNFKHIETIEGSGINVTTKSNISISAQNGTIIIDGMEALTTPIMIYNLNGQRVYNGYDTTVGNLPKGTYIIRIADKTYKIVL